jgi:hypothetical protein
VRYYFGASVKPALIAVAVLASSVHPVFASVDPAVQQALISAEQRSDLTRDLSGPFELDVYFVAQFAVPQSGHLALKWHVFEQKREQFSDYFDFGTHRFPRELNMQLGGSKVLTATVTSLTAASFDESLFTHAPGAIARRECDDMKHPVPINAPEINVPLSAREKGGGGLTVSMTVNVDGSVGDIHVMGSTDIPDAETLKILRAYKFKPAMCGTDAVVSDITVQVDFRVN